MSKILFRDDLKKMCNARIREARLLFANKHYSGAYYLFGLAIECAIKACIAKNTKKNEFPDKDRGVKAFQHDLAALIKLAGLQGAMDSHAATDPGFKSHWAVVKEWKVESRYLESDKPTAESMMNAILQRRHGIMTWIRKHW